MANASLCVTAYQYHGGQDGSVLIVATCRDRHGGCVTSEDTFTTVK